MKSLLLNHVLFVRLALINVPRVRLTDHRRYEKMFLVSEKYVLRGGRSVLLETFAKAAKFLPPRN
jgi:hypothetical protein